MVLAASCRAMPLGCLGTVDQGHMVGPPAPQMPEKDRGHVRAQGAESLTLQANGDTAALSLSS
jgi:hypothetical protein